MVGRTLLANYYNGNMAAHGGKLTAVYTHKHLEGSGEFIPEAGVQDVEWGALKGINALPWQTDTSIGDWYYSENFKYKSTTEIVHTLADVVSKNGNLLLNVVLYPDGSLPPEPHRFLDEMAVWMGVNGEAIHGTRPWKVFGEGPTKAAAGHFSEGAAYTPQDIRFTAKGKVVYAITLGLPAKQVAIESLGKRAGYAGGPIRTVHLLGSKAALKWTQSDDALLVTLPASLPTAHAAALKIELSAPLQSER